MTMALGEAPRRLMVLVLSVVVLTHANEDVEQHDRKAGTGEREQLLDPEAAGVEDQKDDARQNGQAGNPGAHKPHDWARGCRSSWRREADRRGGLWEIGTPSERSVPSGSLTGPG
jgi:hypothetical protein